MEGKRRMQKKESAEEKKPKGKLTQISPETRPLRVNRRPPHDHASNSRCDTLWSMIP